MYKYTELLIEKNPELTYLKNNIKALCDNVVESYNKDGKLMVCGNGGSFADADHIVGEMLKGFLSKRKVPENNKEKFGELADLLQQGIPAVSLGAHGALISAVINDINADMMYAQQVYAMGKEQDVLIGISTSGNAKNICNALKVAKAMGIKTVGMTGNKNGTMNELCDILIDVPESETYLIQEYHLAIYHAFCGDIENIIFESK